MGNLLDSRRNALAGSQPNFDRLVDADLRKPSQQAHLQRRLAQAVATGPSSTPPCAIAWGHAGQQERVGRQPISAAADLRMRCEL
jgi:hypothetical protein